MRNRSIAARLVRALFALAALIALLAGVPAVLLGIGVLPDHLPGIDEITAALTSPDSGQLFLGAVTLIGWYGYLSFVISVVLETGAALRHVRAPRIRMLGGSQQLAGALVGGILVLLPAGTAIASPASAAPVTVATASVTADTPTAAATATKSSASSAWDGPVHRVQDGDTLWDIAEKRLGAGIEWHRIIDVNAGVPQADGSLITADTTVLQPGWTLRLPADASPGPSADQGGAQAQTAGSKAAAETHTVRAGETLTGIAEDELGDADAYPRIVEANKGVKQDDGRVLGDPDEIYPGWKLQIPAATGADDSDRSDSKPEEAQPSREKPTDQGKGEERPGAEQTQPPAQDKPSPGVDQGGKGESAQTPSDLGSDKDRPGGGLPTAHPDAPAEQSQTPVAASADDADDSSVASVALAATSLFAAAVLAVLGGRRALQQRRRRPRRRIPMPQQATATADLEKQLRVASDPEGLDLVDVALRTLAANCAKAGQPLPPLEAVRVTAKGLELYLSAPTPQIAPFAETEEGPDRWWCPARGAQFLDEDQARDTMPPYPALVSLGETADGEPVLVNLESVGALRLTGTGADIRAVMLGMAVELASSGLSDDTTLLLAGLGEELAGVFPIRVEHQEDLAHALPELRAHDALQRRALEAGDLDDLAQARLSEDGGDAWIPKVLIAPTAPSGDEAEALADLLSSRPRTATAIVTEAGDELEVPGAWTLPAAAGTPVQLPGLDLTVTLQRLEEEAYLPLVQLLVTAARTDDVPAPAWTHAPDGTSVPNGPSPIPQRGDSALAQDTADDGDGEGDTAPEEADGQQLAMPPAAPIVQVGVSALRSSSVTAVPDLGLSALAPSVTGAASSDLVEEAEDEIAPEVTALPKELFEETLQEVLDERGDEAEEDEEPQGGEEPEDLDELAAGEAPEGSALSPAALGQPTDHPVEPEATRPVRPTARVTAVTSGVLAALNTPPDPPAAPQIRVLGPVDVIGTLGKVESYRRNGLTEIAAWLALHPGKSRHELDEAVWPGQRVRADTRNTAISKLRAWLGRDPLLAADDPSGAYLPTISGGIYSFNDQVTSDWQQFQAYYREGMHYSGTEADTALASALALVRGRPFSDINQSKYAWAEYDIQEMISAVVDVAHELATRRMAVRDYRAALAAASRGLVCDTMSELLYRDLFTVYSEIGDRQGMERTAHQLTRIEIESGSDSAPETVALINALMDANRIASA
ncbi:LysM peptidoglycan-binding domain-containing protein [Streptomyces sp. NPDC001743]|uniref:LysM peptidoglycan-binding domain-containing protein n=1 Tax=Streptomyces sp. NPDC001743 TaxID=3154397 RepID=UPI00331C08C4